LSLDRDELEEGLEAAKARSGASLEADLEKLSVEDRQPVANDLVGTPGPSSRLGLDIGPRISPVRPWQPDLPSILTVYIVSIAKAQSYPEIIYTHPNLPRHIVFALPSLKIDSWAYKDALTKLLAALRPLIDQSTNILVKPGITDQLDVIRDAGEKELRGSMVDGLSRPVDAVGSRKMIIPIALLLLCAFSLDGTVQPGELSKNSISNVLLSLVALWPDSNPPRAALKRVNEVLLGPGR
jgi:tRNA A64-2'-O-ribosylphosphate transferase